MTVPNVISKEYLDAIKKAKLLEPSDVKKISELTKEQGLRDGKGYGNEMIRNFLYRQYTTTIEVVQLITNYFTAKKEMMEKISERQGELIDSLTKLQEQP